MATKGDQDTSLRSSIALLQERFRQLQKIREMRQEREILHVLSVSESERYSSNIGTSLPTMQKYPCQPSTLLFDSEMNFHQQKPSSQSLALSLWPESQIKHSNLETANGTMATMTNKSWLQGTTLGYNNSEAAFKFDESSSDIDTSLHL